MKMVVTGAAGFIGANFVRYWLARHPGDRVIAVDALTYAGNRANLAGVDCVFAHADIGDLPTMVELLRGVDVVVNFAAIERVLRAGTIGETYNVGSGVEVSAADLAARLLAALNLPTTLIETVEDRPGHDRRYLLDSGKLRRELGWEPTIGFDEGLAATVGWYSSHRSWWEPLLDRSPVNEATWAQP